MNIIITGGAGFLGSRIVKRLLELRDAGASRVDFDEIVSLDTQPCRVDDPRVRSVVTDICAEGVFEEHINEHTTGIFHLAAVLSGGSEEDFDLAMKVNVDATRNLLEAARSSGARPRVVFTSSLAVFGGELPDQLANGQAVQPESTYGTVKAIGEFLVNEYSRKGYIDGRIGRVPTIAVRPGVPNSAASSFASGIIREPLAGKPSVLPVPEDTRLWLSSPDKAVENLVALFELPPETLPAWRVVNLPGITVEVSEMLATLQEQAGTQVRGLVEYAPDKSIIDIVSTWPVSFDVSDAVSWGLTGDEDFASIYHQYATEQE